METESTANKTLCHTGSFPNGRAPPWIAKLGKGVLMLLVCSDAEHPTVRQAFPFKRNLPPAHGAEWQGERGLGLLGGGEVDASGKDRGGRMQM